MDVSDAAKALVEQLGDLPALPTVVSEVLELTGNPESATSEVSEAVEKDPALAAKVLRISNSSYYGMKQYVGTLKLALVILGAREVRNIVLGISVFDTLRGGENEVKYAQQLWNDSLFAGGLNKMLSTEMGLGLQGEEFISGLLSDIGKMALLNIRGEEYRKLLDGSEKDVDALLTQERQLFGLNNGEIAATLTVRWNLPQTLTDALWHQYPTEGRSLQEARDPKLAAVLRITRRAVRDDFEAEETPRCLREDEAWAILGQARRPIAEASRKPLLAGFLKELSGMPHLSI